MELSHLRAILALRELASLARAGDRLHLSPSAVFCQIRQLEDELGQKLYERIGKRLRLTEAGQHVAQHASRIVDLHDSALEALKEKGGAGRSVLRIGCGPHTSLRIMPHLFRAFLAAHPRTEIRLTTSGDTGLLGDLRTGLLDAVMMTLPVNDPELREETLWRYEMVFVAPPKERSGQGMVTLAEIKEKPFILFRRAVVIDAALRELTRQIGFEPNVVMENDEPDSIKELVKLGLGVALLPSWSVAEDSERGDLQILPLPARQFYDYGLLCRTSEYQPRCLMNLLEIAQQWREWWPLARYVAAPQAAAAEQPRR
jgi:DNA-binding transcriptional LysR family regulator